MQYLHGVDSFLPTLSDKKWFFKACSPIRLYPGCTCYSGRHAESADSKVFKSI